jgi:hypothetical protein
LIFDRVDAKRAYVLWIKISAALNRSPPVAEAFHSARLPTGATLSRIDI